MSRRLNTLLTELFNIIYIYQANNYWLYKQKQIGKHMDELKAHTTKYAIKYLQDSDIHSDIYIVFDILSDIIMLLCIKELLMQENN